MIRALTTLALALAAFPAAGSSTPQDAGAPARRGGPTLLVLNKSVASLSWVDPVAGRVLASVPVGVGPHEVAVSADGKTAVVCDYGQQTPGQTLTVLDVTGRRAPRKIDLGENRRPHGIQFEDDDRHVIVTTEESRAIVRVDVVEGKVVDVLKTNQGASHMLVLTPDRHRAFVANIASNTVTVFDIESGDLEKQIETGKGPEGIDVTPDGKEVWVANRQGDDLVIIDAKTLEIRATLATGKFPIRVKITPDGSHALVSNAQSGDVQVFSVEARTEVARIPMQIDVEAEDLDERLFGDRFGQSPVPVGILVQPDGERAYVANTNADIVTVIDCGTWEIAARIPTEREPDGLGWTTLPAPVEVEAEPVEAGTKR